MLGTKERKLIVTEAWHCGLCCTTFTSLPAIVVHLKEFHVDAWKASQADAVAALADKTGIL